MISDERLNAIEAQWMSEHWSDPAQVRSPPALVARENIFELVAEVRRLQGFKAEWMAAVDTRLRNAVAAEREACAKIAENERFNIAQKLSYPPQSSAACHIEWAIRAREVGND